MSIYRNKKELMAAFANGITIQAIYRSGRYLIWELVSSVSAWFRSEGWFRSEPW